VGTTINHYVTTAHTKNPTFTQMIASTAFDATLVVLTIGVNNVSNGDSSSLLDIAIGAASSETVIIPDLMAGFVGDVSVSAGSRHYIFPLYIPAGSRISARTQSVRTSGSMTVYVQLFGGPHNPDRWWYGQQVTAYGHNAANSAGTKFTPGDTGAEGTGVSLGTTTANHGCLVLGVQGHPDDVAWAGRTYHFDVGLDSTATQWLLADYWIAGSTSTELLGCDGLWLPLFWPVLSGSVLMVRGECSGTADALSAAIYGVS